MTFSYSKVNKLKSKRVITQLFSEGKTITAYPLKLIYVPYNFTDGTTLKTGVSVSKRLHKTAVARNGIKRLMRETYRLNKPLYVTTTTSSYAVMILYLSKDKTTFNVLNTRMQHLLKTFNSKIKTHENTTS